MGGRDFYKMTGSGNDFVFLDGRYHATVDWPPTRIANVCDRRLGVGADGLVFLTPGDRHSVQMTYFNSDGSPAPICGNALLCSARLAVYLGFSSSEKILLRCKSGDYEAELLETSRMAILHFQNVQSPVEVLDVPLGPHETQMLLLQVGVPHLVVIHEDVSVIDTAVRGRELRSHPRFGPHGVNVNFVSPVASTIQTFRIRTYERGVEEETFACGTGAVAAAAALALTTVVSLPIQFLTRSDKIIEVQAHPSAEGLQNVKIIGAATLLYRGTLVDLRTETAHQSSSASARHPFHV